MRRKIHFLLVDNQPEDIGLFYAAMRVLSPDFRLHIPHKRDLLLDTTKNLLPDILFLNDDLPGCSYRETLKVIMSDPVAGNIPLIMFSTPESSKAIRECYEAGAARYFIKPLNAAGMQVGLEIILHLHKTCKLVRPSFDQFLITTNHGYFTFSRDSLLPC